MRPPTPAFLRTIAFLAGVLYASIVAYLVNAVLDQMSNWAPLERAICAFGTGLVTQCGLFAFALLRTPSFMVRVVLTLLLLPNLIAFARFLPQIPMGGQHRVPLFCIFAAGFLVYASAIGSLWFGPWTRRRVETTTPS
jgi:hypothetical protein